MPKSDAFNCDCLDFMRQLPDGYFDICIADPVYGEVTGGGTQPLPMTEKSIA